MIRYEKMLPVLARKLLIRFTKLIETTERLDSEFNGVKYKANKLYRSVVELANIFINEEMVTYEGRGRRAKEESAYQDLEKLAGAATLLEVPIYKGDTKKPLVVIEGVQYLVEGIRGNITTKTDRGAAYFEAVAKKVRKEFQSTPRRKPEEGHAHVGPISEEGRFDFAGNDRFRRRKPFRPTLADLPCVDDDDRDLDPDLGLAVFRPEFD